MLPRSPGASRLMRKGMASLCWQAGWVVKVSRRGRGFCIAYPDTAARVFDYMWQYTENLRALYETPNVAEDVAGGTAARAAVEDMLDKVRGTGRTLLTEFESKQVLARYGIATVDTRIARSEKAAVQFARALGFPVVLKLYSETITHKTDVGGVQLNLPDEDSVRNAYKAIESSVRE